MRNSIGSATLLFLVELRHHRAVHPGFDPFMKEWTTVEHKQESLSVVDEFLKFQHLNQVPCIFFHLGHEVLGNGVVTQLERIHYAIPRGHVSAPSLRTLLVADRWIRVSCHQLSQIRPRARIVRKITIVPADHVSV